MKNGSWRRAPLPPGWYKIRQKVFRRDGYRCTHIRQDSTGGRCPEKATHCDHVIPGGPDTMENLTSLCAYHHKIKSSSEGGRRVHQNGTRPARKHPGQI